MVTTFFVFTKFVIIIYRFYYTPFCLQFVSTVVKAGFVLKKCMYRILAQETTLLVLVVSLLGRDCRLEQQRLLCRLWSLRLSLCPYPVSGYRVRCEGREWSRGSEVRLETQGAGPALPRSYPSPDKKHMWEPATPTA